MADGEPVAGNTEFLLTLLRETKEELGRVKKEHHEEFERAKTKHHEELDRIRKERSQEQQANAELQKLIRQTSLIDFLNSHHKLIYSKLDTSSNGAKTKGNILVPEGRYCPKTLRPWTGFLEERDRIFAFLKQNFPPSRYDFARKIHLEQEGHKVSLRPVTSELALRSFLNQAIENSVNDVFRVLAADSVIKKRFCLGSGLTFEDHLGGTTNSADTTVDSAVGSELSSLGTKSSGGRRKESDQVCVYITDKEPEAPKDGHLLYVAEYKPPHKLTVDQLRQGLGPMNILEEHVNNSTIPSRENEAESTLHSSKNVTACAVSQEYHYMIENRLEYGLLTTGKAFVFLKIDWNDPTTLRYYLALPDEQVQENPENSYALTAIGQCLAFTLMAHLRTERQQEDRQISHKGLVKWIPDDRLVLDSIPKEEQTPPTPPDIGSDSCPTDDDSSEAEETRPKNKKKKRPVSNAGTDETDVTNDEEEPSDNDADGPAPPHPKKKPRICERDMDKAILRDDEKDPTDDEQSSFPMAAAAQAAATTGGSCAEHATGQTKIAETTIETSTAETAVTEFDLLFPAPIRRRLQLRAYCTQKCLLGLVTGSELDIDCPNVALHAKEHANADARFSHPVSQTEFVELVRRQMKKSLDDGIITLNLSGARGALLQVTLLQYGYTFVCKGTSRECIKHLDHGAAVYARLQPLQGTHIPVFLGVVDLRPMDKTYFYSPGIRLVHLTCLSWGGESMRDSLDGDDPTKAESLAKMAETPLQAIHQHGVVHKDVRLDNMLLNPRTNTVTIIDFERSLLLDPPQRPLGQLVPSKRKRENRRTARKLKQAPEFSRDFWDLADAFRTG